MIYHVKPDFPILIERAGLRSSQLARDVGILPSSFLHISAGRRNVGGAIVARIARIYAGATDSDQDTATAALFDLVAEKKQSGQRRQRGANGQFTKEE